MALLHLIQTLSMVLLGVKIFAKLSGDCWNTKENLSRQRRFVKTGPNFNDPLFTTQWYLNDAGRMNIVEAWREGYTGKGVVVSVVDEGVDGNHEEFKNRFNLAASYNFVTNTSDPKPARYQSHGQKVAGIIAGEANNSKCGVGIAYDASIGGIKFIGAKTGPQVSKDYDQHLALSYKRDLIDIYACAWGPDDILGMSVGYNKAPKAIESGAKFGRSGKGSIFVFAAGNEGFFSDSCTYDGYVSSMYTFGISSINPDGTMSKSAERCPAIIAVTYVRDGQQAFDDKSYPMATAGTENKCESVFTSSSAATAVASGIFALTLQANPSLTWRDLHHIIVRTAINDQTKAVDNDVNGKSLWKSNHAGFKVNTAYGFGILNAREMVTLAKSWRTVSRQLHCSFRDNTTRTIPQNGKLNISVTSFASCPIMYLEHSVLTMNLTFTPRKNLQVELISARGTSSLMLMPGRFYDNAEGDVIMYPVSTLHNWGEDSNGTWQVVFQNIRPDVNLTFAASVSYFEITLYGTSTAPDTSTTPTSPHTSTLATSIPDKDRLTTERPGSSGILNGQLSFIIATVITGILIG